MESCRRSPKCRGKALEKLDKEIGDLCFFRAFDVSKSEEVENFALSLEENLGVPDLLVNNAGIINQNAPLTQISPEEFASVLSINLGGIHHMIRSFVTRMEKQGHGIIANFSSYWGAVDCSGSGTPTVRANGESKD